LAPDPLKIAFLIGRDDMRTQSAIARVCELNDVRTVAVLLDTDRPRLVERMRNLKRNMRRQGLGYVYHRALSAIRGKFEEWADGVIPQEEVEQLLLHAFPERSLDHLARQYGFQVFQAGNLNSASAVEYLRSAGAELGVVLGTRILKRRIFSIPRLGCINLHKGQVPEYRGMPPGFWELYDGRESAGVTVHFVDDGLDTGDVVGTATVPIHPKETPESLRSKLDLEGNRLLVSVIHSIQLGTAVRRAQPAANPPLPAQKPRTLPTQDENVELARRLPHWRRLSDGRQALKTAIWLALFHSGFYSFVRWARPGRSRGAILLYHRVNDISSDVLTASIQRFAEHLVTLRRFYRVVTTTEMVERIASRTPIEPTSVAIHFDDCYRDVRTFAAPLLEAAGAPATTFVSSGFVDTMREFLHDQAKCPHRFENLRTEDLRELPGLGVEVAAHTVNHVDLGSVSLEKAQLEVEESRKELERLTSRPVLLFSFPFGGIYNIREEVRQMIMAAGYHALFSAHGGFVDQSTTPFDIPRIGVSSDHSALALMMELEGVSLAHFKHWLGQKFRKRTRGI
jgi:peptidoglycan/xylan/chitin deacetylase (PgdA/CDA1 family)